MFEGTVKKIQELVGYTPKKADNYEIPIDVVLPDVEEERVTQIDVSELEEVVTEENPLVKALRLQKEAAFRTAYPSSGICYGGCDNGVYNRDLAISHGAVPFYTKLQNTGTD